VVVRYKTGVGSRGDTIIHSIILNQLQLFTLTLESRRASHAFPLRLQKNGNRTQFISSYRAGQARGYAKLMEEATCGLGGAPTPSAEWMLKLVHGCWWWLVPAP